MSRVLEYSVLDVFAERPLEIATRVQLFSTAQAILVLPVKIFILKVVSAFSRDCVAVFLFFPIIRCLQCALDGAYSFFIPFNF